jgi:hypothetical protein
MATAMFMSDLAGLSRFLAVCRTSPNLAYPHANAALCLPRHSLDYDIQQLGTVHRQHPCTTTYKSFLLTIMR